MRSLRRAIKIIYGPDKYKGQATLEITLLIVVAVGLLLLFSAKIYTPMGQFTKAYMGDYLACLLDYGVLPQLGSEDDICLEFKTIKNNPLSAGNSKGPIGSSSSSGSSGANSGKRPSPEQLNLRQSRSGGSSQSAQNSSRFPQGVGADAATNNEKITELEEINKGNGYYRIRRSSSSSVQQGRIVGSVNIDQLSIVEKEKIKRKAERAKSVVIMEQGQDGRNVKKLLIKPPDKKSQIEEKEEPWGFGKLIRMLIIAAIILAILLFILGQAVQISKAWEK